MPSSVRSKSLDARGWRTATLSAPFVIQGLLALLIVNAWLLGKWPFGTHSASAGERPWLSAALLVTTVEGLLISAVLRTAQSSRRRGLSLSVASCSAVLLIGGAVFAYEVLR